jgi:flagella basal body P-ring formation protein FlgA
VRRLIEAQLPAGLALVSVTLTRAMGSEHASPGLVTVTLPRSLTPGRVSAKVTRPVGRSSRSAQVACVLAAVGPVIVVDHALAEGAILTEADVVLVQQALPSGAVASTPTALEATRRRLVGATLRRAMAERAPITDEDVAPTPPIARGAAVQFELRRGGLLVRGRGTLERAARIGEQVLVRLSAASTPVRGTLVSATEVVLEGAS